MSWTRESRATSPISRAILAGAALAICSSAAHSAAAQTHSGDAAMAETLFNDAKRKMAAGDFASACPKLAESYRLDAGSGTLTALAVCHEGLGKTASAWTEFIEVVSEARQTGRADREKFAQQHVDAIEPKLSKLTVAVEPAVAKLSGLEVRRDGTLIGQAGWGTAAPVDPGPHTVEVKAPGKKPWSTTVTVGPSHDVQTVTVTRLEDTPAPSPSPVAPAAPSMGASLSEGAATEDSTAPPRPEQPSSSSGGTQRTVGLVVGGAGIVAAGVGTYFGLQAISQTHQANNLCPVASDCTSADALSKNSSAKSSALVSDVLFGGALAAVGLGAILYATSSSGTSPGASTAALRVVPGASARGASVVFDGTW
jgi:hypothetical protein